MDPDIENTCVNTKGKIGGGMNWEIGIDVYTLLILYIRYITNENLLYNIGKYTQCSVVA